MSTSLAAIQIERLMAEIEQLSCFSDAAAPAVTRVLYTPSDMAARQYLQELAAAANFEWHTDAVGNSFIRWPGTQPGLPAVATGSHMDAVPFSGKYDGVVGVLGGLEALRLLRAGGFIPQRTLELILFTAEEPTRFSLGCIGSRVLSGMTNLRELQALHDADGITFEQARRMAGFSGDIESARLPRGHYHAFLELHIEQGPVLETKRIPIGVVTGIAASSTSQITFEGSGGHAGTVPMDIRNDPLPGAAELALATEQTALKAGQDAVATVGKLAVHPGASNSIPRMVQLSLDVRHVDETVRDQMVHHLMQTAQDIALRRGLIHESEIINSDPALQCAPQVVAAVEAAAGTLALPAVRLVSRAYHDTVFMGAICPVGMIFIPCRHGYSHRPEEYSSPEHIAAGVQVLALSLARLAGGTWS
jgi:N-carbamoyl-L-amino-acid hydrolase